MTNAERLRNLTDDELAWFLMAYSDTCRCCVYKKLRSDESFGYSLYECGNKLAGDTCYGGYQKWLARESTKDDDFQFRVCTHNILVDRWNSLGLGLKDGFELKYENGMAVRIQPIADSEIPDKPLPF